MREGRIVHEAAAGELDEDAVLDLVMAGIDRPKGATSMTDITHAPPRPRRGQVTAPAQRAGWWRDDASEPVRRNLGLVGVLRHPLR